MKHFLMIAALVIATSLQSFAAETDKSPAAQPKDKEIKAADFANMICSAAKSGPKELVGLINIEFTVRSSITEKELKESGLNIEEAVKQNQDILQNYAEMADKNGQDIAETCRVIKTGDKPCKDVYDRLSKSGVFSDKPIPVEKLEEVGKLLKIESCSVLTMSKKDKGKDKEAAADFIAAKVGGEWKIIAMIILPQAEDDEKKPGKPEELK